MKFILFNPKSNNSNSKVELDELLKKLEGQEVTVKEVIGFNVKELVANLKEEDEIIIVGGDGTLNHFVNDLDDKIPANNIYFYPAGTGNDFINDIGGKHGELILVNKYLNDLPWVILEGNKKFYFLNNVGFGIDGYCCEVADKKRGKGKEKINYTSIAIGGLLGGYHPVKAEVEVDGEKFSYKHVFLAPSQNGRYVGGGMKMAPDQDRLNAERKVSFVVFKAAFRLKALLNFKKVFTGDHVRKKGLAEVKVGNHVKVKFNRPTALQIDGETFVKQLWYEVFTSKAK